MLLNKILIFGGSGSLGQAIFKELNPFFDVYCTYYSQKKFKKNKRYFYFDISNEFDELLNIIKPNLFKIIFSSSEIIKYGRFSKLGELKVEFLF